MTRARWIWWRLAASAIPLSLTLSHEARRHGGELLHLHISGRHLHSGEEVGSGVQEGGSRCGGEGRSSGEHGLLPAAAVAVHRVADPGLNRFGYGFFFIFINQGRHQTASVNH
jgi:hypothetical protein